ncbi:MAG: histone H1, partial [Bacteroidetes bacterium]|nr:histone H1 [Bacteroidota bacterium]
MKELVAKINAEFETFTAETESLIEKGVKAAGARARKSTLEMEKMLKEFRKLSI